MMETSKLSCSRDRAISWRTDIPPSEGAADRKLELQCGPGEFIAHCFKTTWILSFRELSDIKCWFNYRISPRAPIQTAKTDHHWTAFVRRERIQSLANVLPAPPRPPRDNFTHLLIPECCRLPTDRPQRTIHQSSLSPSTAKKIESSHQPFQDILIERVNLCNSSSDFLGSPFSRSTRSFQILPGFVTKAEAWGWRKPTQGRSFPPWSKTVVGCPIGCPASKLAPLASEHRLFHCFHTANQGYSLPSFFFFLKWSLHIPRDAPAV